MALVLRHILAAGGFTTGGFNFDAKLRRQSIDVDDLFIAHVGGVDVLARGLVHAAAMIEDGTLERASTERYAGWRQAEGQRILKGDLSLSALADAAGDPKPRSGKQELLENYVNSIA
jgi:xylose isomerase